MEEEEEGVGAGAALTAPEKELFQKLEEDACKAEDDAEEQARVVQDFEGSKSARVPWLGTLGFPAHLRGLKDDEIKASYALPPKRVLDGDIRAAST